MRRSDIEVEGLAATVVEPDRPNGRVVFCFPGGGMSRRYFDLDGTYSMAGHLAGSGFTVVAVDHPGVGDSPPPAEPWDLTPSYVADRDAGAVAALRTRIGGTAIGLGHSMGSMLTVVAQARHRCFDALALLGWAHGEGYRDTALAGHLSPEELALVGDPSVPEANIVELAKRRFGRPLPVGSTTTSEFLLGGMAVTAEGLEAIAHARSALLAVCGLASMLKLVGPDVAALDVPVLVGVGERDITVDVRQTAPSLAACPDITLYVLPGAGHNHNIAPNRTALWERVAVWAEGI